MSTLVKYRIHEVAKDFGMPTKDITELVTKYYEKPKNHMQILEEDQLNLIFDYITQHHQIDSLEEVFAVQSAQQPAPQQEPAKQAPKPQAAQQAAPQPQQQPAARPAKQTEPQRKRERRVVDTSAVTVNTARFDDHVDELVSERVQNYQGGKQRFTGRNGKNNKKKGAFISGKQRSEEQEKMRRLQLEIAKKTPLTVHIPEEIAVGELASRMKKTGAEVVKALMKMGVMASLSQTIDYDTAALIAMDFGCKVEKEVIMTIEDRLIDDHEDTDAELITRSPVVVVMGHVDHGKTSLLDAVRKTNVASAEAGGITQHIGAYTVNVGGRQITFLDTPGHEAFTSMRARGAMCTDVAILVVAADDGIMPQTIEAINHAKAAEIPIIVAINKMDKPGANPERIKQQIMEYELIPEEYGGDTIICPISAKTGEGIESLLEMVLLTADMLARQVPGSRGDAAGAERHAPPGRCDHCRHRSRPRPCDDRRQGPPGQACRPLRPGGDHRLERGPRRRRQL